MGIIADCIEVLQLDNFLQMLTFEERLQTCQYRAGHTDEVPKRVIELKQWIQRTRWKPPKFKISQDRELLWYDWEASTYRPLKQHDLYRKKII